MKKIITVSLCLMMATLVIAQGNNGKNKEKDKQKNNPSAQQGNPGQSDPGNSGSNKQNKNQNNNEAKQREEDHDRKVWDGIGDKSCMKPSKNQPAKVRAAFQRDFPYAMNVRWTKCRGDWTATFDRLPFRSTAVYHANGDRRDTRTPVRREDVPRRILDVILKRRPDTRLDDAIKIEVPNAVKEIFRIKNILEGKAVYEYYDADGAVVDYNY